MSIDYVALKAELDASHPVSGAYSANDQLAADQLNALDISVERITPIQEAADATDADEFNALPDLDRNMWVAALAWDQINLNAGIGLATAQGIWSGVGNATTRLSLIATRTELVNRTSQLNFGRATLTNEHVAHARTF